MWLKKHSEITQYIPQDGKYHDIQIINDSVYVDGKLKNPKPFTEIKIFSRLLNNEEVVNLYEPNNEL